ncbi:MAG: sigma-70 family RNA polymerase sigma factor [Bacteroidota bacterium]
MNTRETQNFGLTEERFEELLAQLRQGNENLFEHIFLAHFADCRSYLEREDGVSEDIAYDATMDAMLTFRESLGRGKIAYGNLRFLLTRMARQHLYKKLKKERDLPLSEHPVPDLPEDLELDDTAFKQLQSSWRKLGDRCKALLERVYYDCISMVDIAKQEERKVGTVRKQKERCVKQLRGLMVE